MELWDPPNDPQDPHGDPQEDIRNPQGALDPPPPHLGPPGPPHDGAMEAQRDLKMEPMGPPPNHCEDPKSTGTPPQISRTS